jgi:hypothetical protein
MTGASFAIVAVAIACFFATGHLLLGSIIRRTQLFWFERWAAAYLAGMAALSGLWFALAPFFHPLWVLAVCSAGASLLSLRAKTGSGGVFTEASGLKSCATTKPLPTPFDIALAVLISVECAALFVAALRTPLGFDGVFNFEMKASLMFFDQSHVLPVGYIGDVSRNWSHPQYPLMVPFGELWIYSWLGRVDHGATKLLFPLFYVSLIALVCGAVRRVAGLRPSLATGAALGLMPPLTLIPGAASGYADVPLAAATAGAVSFTWLALRNGARDAALLAGMMSAIAAWTKSEGIVLAGTVGILALVFRYVLARRSSCTLSVAASSAPILVPAVVLAPWLILQHVYGIPAADFLPITIANAVDNLDRVPIILELLVWELVRPGHWGLLWPAWCVAVLLVITNRRRIASDLFLIGAVAIPLVLYVVPFVFSSWTDVDQHVRSALPRILVPLAPIALWLTAATFWREWETRAS